MMRSYSFKDKTVLISGGSRGLGLLLARHLGGEGARLVLLARHEEELEAAKMDLEERGYPVAIKVCDVTKQEQVNDAVSYARECFGDIDVLINNAGVISVGPMDEMTVADYEEAMNTHFWAPLYLTQAVSPAMRERKSGRIINIASVGAKVSVPHMLPYCASKFALLGYSDGLRGELLKDNVFVTSVCPGLMRTGSHKNAYFKGQNKSEFAWFSVSNASPLISIDADEAAKQIIDASRRGDSQLIISLPAQLISKLNGLFPGAFMDAIGLTNIVLPGPGGIGENRARGKESESSWSPSVLTAMADSAAERNNEV